MKTDEQLIGDIQCICGALTHVQELIRRYRELKADHHVALLRLDEFHNQRSCAAINRCSLEGDCACGVDGLCKELVNVYTAAGASPEPSSSAKTWCEYVAGMVGCYLGEPVESDKCKAIAGIIERRLWALPAPQPDHLPNAGNMVQQAANELIALAARAGQVVTIERRPLKPLAMGNAEYVVETWPVRDMS